jgi:nitrite reductase/ring-hydroxylating ferredoxin subunit
MARVVVASIADLPEQRGVPVRVGALRVALFRVGEGVFAVEDRCPHRDFPLHDGTIEAGTVRCRTHGSCFDLATGDLARGPARHGVRVFAAHVVAGRVELEIEI